MTKQRQMILEVLQNTKAHPTADWIYEQVRQAVPRISLGTVYRNLRVLKEMGDIQELNYGSTYSRFDGNPAPHYHFVCQDCGKVMDIDLPLLTDYDEQVAGTVGGQVDFHRMEFYGNCSDCLT
ncbi:Fur family transcriptional regulator [Dethiobacter alkaliphilus]|nr:transcriptional repressor [Dethiobacter alkaliphilus]MCW3489855.1 transcriptional repressor [Dethiobacter alkaliphilus]